MNNQDDKQVNSDDCSSGVADASTTGGSAVNITATTATAPATAAAVAAALPVTPQNDTSAEATTSTSLQERLYRAAQQSRNERRDVKRSTIKHLIERYFFQLQRGCGNPKCDNEFCASSGKVKDMTPNEAAAMALQLFSQDAKLCNASGEGQSDDALERLLRSTDSTECSNSNSSGSGQSTIILGSSLDSTSSPTSPTTANITATTNNSSSTANNLDTRIPATAQSTLVTSEMQPNDKDLAAANVTSADATQQTPNTATTNTTTSTTVTPVAAAAAAAVGVVQSSQPTMSTNDLAVATMAAINFLNERVGCELIDECVRENNFERLWIVIEHVFSDVDRLSGSFIGESLPKEVKAFTVNAEQHEPHKAEEQQQPADKEEPHHSKLATALLMSPLGELNKEALRTLEGETDKDEDSTEPPPLISSTDRFAASLATTMDIDSIAGNRASTSAGIGLGISPITLDSGRQVIPRIGVADLNAAFAELEALQNEVPQPHSIFSHIFNDDESQSSAISNQSEWESDQLPNYYIDLDFAGLRAFKKKLFDLHHPDFYDVLNNSMVSLSGSCMRYKGERSPEKILHCLVICFDMMSTPTCSHSVMEFVDRALPPLCKVAAMLPISTQARLTRIWSVHCRMGLRSLVESFQQLITLQVIADEDNVQESPLVIATTKVLRMVYYASIMAGEMDIPSPSVLNDTTESFFDGDGAVGGLDDASTSAGHTGEDDFAFANMFHMNIQRHENRLETILGVSAMDSRVPYVPFEEFYNEPLSDAIHMDNDYLAYKNLLMDPENEDHHFSFMCYSFILNPACKVVALYYDSRIRMYSERNSSLYSLLSFNNSDGDVRPDLRLKVRRDKLINDALSGLEMVAMSNPKDLKKQLVVEFVGEQGIDEGGVSKEFFQLIIEEIFNPDIGMFITMEETNTMWFNSSALESDSQFTLIGIILGLAIYNNIILAVNFPKVVYRKLMNGRGTYYDLREFSPTLFRSLDYLLKYDKEDIDDVFMQTFRVNYVTVFGVTMEHDLKPGGGDITVTQENKREFVDLYADFLLNKLVERQFRAFKKGFDMVTDESPLKLLFRPEEIELLVCGSSKFDFKELEKSTEYEGGYTKESQIIKDFWTIVHGMPLELKRKLLEFTTGSDRVPVGGFSRLKLLITRNGPDSDRLPTSHTCFNVLLLPEYSDKTKLEERLLKAINYSKGFGML